MEEGAKLLPATVPEPAKSSLQTVFQSAARTQRKWLASFRIRWDARIGALRIQEHVPLHVMQSKAHDWEPQIHQIRFVQNPSKSSSWSSYFSNFVRSVANAVPKMGPLDGPIFGTAGHCP